MRFYRYPAIISLDSDTGLYSVEFVDFPIAVEKGIEKDDVDFRSKEILYEAMGKHLETNETRPNRLQNRPEN